MRGWAKKQGFSAYTDDGTLRDDAFFQWKRNHPDTPYPAWVTVSQLGIVPYYDRSNLIQETLGTLENALTHEILITIIVVLVMVLHMRSSLLISGMLPLSILMTFIAMKIASVGANIVSLSGIAIAIGTVVAMGIIICENILRHLERAGPDTSMKEIVQNGASEVGGAVLTAIATTVVSFLPVFFMVGPAGKLFRPLAYTKTFAMVAAAVISLTMLPPLAHLLFAVRMTGSVWRSVLNGAMVGVGVVLGVLLSWWVGLIVAVTGGLFLVQPYLPEMVRARLPHAAAAGLAVIGTYLLATVWMPLGFEHGVVKNLLFVAGTVAFLLALLFLVQKSYGPLLAFFLRWKTPFLGVTVLLLFAGGVIWQNLGKEFRPDLDEGSFLYMPTTSKHASIGEAKEGLRKQNQTIRAIPEVKTVVGKIGRIQSPLDPAPISMVETIIRYKSEFRTDDDGNVLRFRYDAENEAFVRDQNGDLIRDPDGRPYRQWRNHIESPDDIWEAIADAAKLPGWTGVSKLQPIETRLIMLQTGLRASLGVKVKGPSLDDIEQAAIELERQLKNVPAVKGPTVVADRIVGKPYLEIDINRDAIARYGMSIKQVQNVIEVAIGGRPITTTVEGRERYAVRVRYKRELRSSIDDLKNVLVPAKDGKQIPLQQLARIRYVKGPQMIKGEDTNLVAYISFEKTEGVAEVEAVRQARQFLDRKIDRGELVLPPGVSFEFAGSYKNQVQAQKTMAIILPVALIIIFLILYFQFGSVSSTIIVFSGILVAWAGGFVMMWLYGQEWFLNVVVAGVNLRELFNIHTVNLSVAVWVGFLALFGIATDHGVLIATRLDQAFRRRDVASVEQLRERAVSAALERIRPSMMMIGVTILALLPVMTSTGKGANVMVPMAIPSFGGMMFGIMTVLVVPVLYTAVREFRERTELSRTAVQVLTVLSLFIIPVLYTEYRTFRERMLE